MRNYELKDILIEDRNTYNKAQFENYLLELRGRFAPVTTRIQIAYGVLGFVRFLKGFYLVLITSRKRVAKIARHSIYQIKDM